MKTFLIAMLLASSAFAGETVLETSVYFDTGKSALTSEAVDTLDRVADAVRQTDAVVAVGNTDVRPFKASTNHKLGLARAEAVKSYLVKRGVPASAISTSTLGETKARSNKKSALGMAKDRRVDITVTRITPEPIPTPPVVVERIVEKKVVCPPAPVVKPTPPPEDPWYRLAGIVEVGGGARAPHWEGLAGLRVTFPKVRLGLQAHTNLQYGLGLEGLVYPIMTKSVNWKLNLGVNVINPKLLSTTDVPRTWDVTAGTGVEILLPVKHLYAFTIDWRMSAPNPVYILQHDKPIYQNGAQVYGEAGRYLDVKHVLGNSFTQGHLLVGLLFN